MNTRYKLFFAIIIILLSAIIFLHWLTSVNYAMANKTISYTFWGVQYEIFTHLKGTYAGAIVKSCIQIIEIAIAVILVMGAMFFVACVQLLPFLCTPPHAKLKPRID